MNIGLYVVFPIVWIILMFGLCLLIIKLLVLRRINVTAGINLSTGIYLSSLAGFSAWLLAQAKEKLAPMSNMIANSFPPAASAHLFMLIINISSGLLLLFLLNLFLSKFATRMVSGGRNESVELESNNIGFAILRSSMVLACGLLIISMSDTLFLWIITASTN